MPKLVHCQPKYRKHKATGQAVVTLSGRDFYLGEYGTKISRLEYDRLVAEWLQNGRTLTQSADGGGITVVELAAAYWRHAETYYVKNGKATDEIASIRVALRFLREHFGHEPTSDFGPLALKAVRQKMIDAGHSRGYINNNVSRIKRTFKWGVEQELVPAIVHGAPLCEPP